MSKDEVQLLLLEQMEYLSCEWWQASWLDGLEYILWEYVCRERLPTTIQREAEIKQLILFATNADGWFWFPEDAEGPVFILMKDWLKQYAKWRRGEVSLL